VKQIDHTEAYGEGGDRLHVAVYGRVQGVGFREFVRRAARQVGELRGWVRNRRDGSVEIEAAGGAEQIARLRARVREGPSWSRVDRVEELLPGEEPLPHPFEIRR
jgi:acylphosphatase